MKTNQQIALEVIQGKWGNGTDRKKKLTDAGYNYASVQSIVNALMKGDAKALQTLPVPGDVVISGKETYEVTINLSKYNSLSITFVTEDSDMNELLEGWD